jgi:hypothetical protein
MLAAHVCFTILIAAAYIHDIFYCRGLTVTESKLCLCLWVTCLSCWLKNEQIGGTVALTGSAALLKMIFTQLSTETVDEVAVG